MCNNNFLLNKLRVFFFVCFCFLGGGGGEGSEGFRFVKKQVELCWFHCSDKQKVSFVDRRHQEKPLYTLYLKIKGNSEKMHAQFRVVLAMFDFNQKSYPPPTPPPPPPPPPTKPFNYAQA